MPETPPAARTRDTRIDVVKGYAILLVVVGHAVQRAELFHLVTMPAWTAWVPFSGHLTMPLFLAVSGYLAYGSGAPRGARWLSAKATMLLVPWGVWTLLYYPLLHDPLIVTSLPFSAYVRSQVLAPSLWYLPVLFACYVLLVAGSRVGDWALVVLGVLAGFVTFAWAPLVAWYWWWFLAGYLAAKHKPVLARLALPATGVVLVGYALALVLSPAVSTTARVFFGVAGIALGLLVARLVRRGALARGLAYLGVHSLPVYVAQFFFVQLVVVRSALNIPLVVVAAVAGSLALEWLLSRNPATAAAFLGGRVQPRVVPIPVAASLR